MIVVCTIAATGTSHRLYAQVAPEVAEAIQAVVANPADPEATFELARAADRSGDLVSAADALERVLRLRPDLPNVAYQLGVIYLALEAPELAEMHLRDALASPGMPAAIRDDAEKSLRAANDQSRRNIVHGSVSLGVRNDTNVNASPSSPEVYAFGFPALLDSVAVEDSSSFVDAGIAHRFWFGERGRHSLETTARYMTSAYSEATTLDSRIFDVDSGPLLAVGAPEAPTTFRPFLSLTSFYLDGEGYLDAQGAGLEVQKTLRSGLGFFARTEHMERTFSATAERPSVEDRSGDLDNSSVGLVFRARTGWEFALSFFEIDNEAAAQYESYDSDGSSLSIAKFFRGRRGQFWSVSLSGAQLETTYLAPDPQVATFLMRTDERVDLFLSLDAPITQRLSVRVQLDQLENESTVPNTDFDNDGAAVSFRWSF